MKALLLQHQNIVKGEKGGVDLSASSIQYSCPTVVSFQMVTKSNIW